MDIVWIKHHKHAHFHRPSFLRYYLPPLFSGNHANGRHGTSQHSAPPTTNRHLEDPSSASHEGNVCLPIEFKTSFEGGRQQISPAEKMPVLLHLSVLALSVILSFVHPAPTQHDPYKYTPVHYTHHCLVCVCLETNEQLDLLTQHEADVSIDYARHYGFLCYPPNPLFALRSSIRPKPSWCRIYR